MNAGSLPMSTEILLRPIREIMTENVITIQANRTLLDAAKLMYTHKIGGLPVVNEDRLVGIITERDLTKTTALGANPRVTPVTEFMSSPVITCSPNASISEVLKIMCENHVCHMVVVDEMRKLIGIVSSRDLVCNGVPLSELRFLFSRE
jgi:CBS domain-containing protein